MDNKVELKRAETAIQSWDRRWQSQEGREDWLIPEKDVIDAVPLMRERNVRSVLDLGCGVGRHAFFLVQEGFVVHAVDASQSAIEFIQKKSQVENLPIHVQYSEMINLPFENGSMDAVLAWNVIYHGDLPIVKRVVSEILRILKPGGLFLGKRSCDCR